MPVLAVACIDCLAEGQPKYRPTPHGGPRSPLCVTHFRARKKKTSKRAHELRTEKTYGITAEEYQMLYNAQQGKCFICQRATGATKRLAVDHDHAKQGCFHPVDQGCRQCVRCLACGPCNELLGRYTPQMLARAITVLTNPPARRVLDENAGCVRSQANSRSGN